MSNKENAMVDSGDDLRGVQEEMEWYENYNKRPARPHSGDEQRRQQQEQEQQQHGNNFLEQVLQPTMERVLQPTMERVLQPTIERALQPTMERVLQPMMERAFQPTMERVLQPTLDRFADQLEVTQNMQQQQRHDHQLLKQDVEHVKHQTKKSDRQILSLQKQVRELANQINPPGPVRASGRIQARNSVLVPDPVRASGRAGASTPVRRASTPVCDPNPVRVRAPHPYRRARTPVRDPDPNPARVRAPNPVRRARTPVRDPDPNPVRVRAPNPHRRARTPVRDPDLNPVRVRAPNNDRARGPAPAAPALLRQRQHRAVRYTEADDQRMVHYLISTGNIKRAKGNSVWEELRAVDEDIAVHNAGGLRQHFKTVVWQKAKGGQYTRDPRILKEFAALWPGN